MSRYMEHVPSTPMMFGYDPLDVLSDNHLARLVDLVVDESVQVQQPICSVGRPAYDPRVCLKVLVYGYSIGIRSSRQMERLCQEHLAFLFLTRGQAPSYRTLCAARVALGEELIAIWLSLFAVAKECGLQRLGRVTLDSTKFRANASDESVVTVKEYGAVKAELEAILAESLEADAHEEAEGAGGQTDLDKALPGDEQMRGILRRVRAGLAKANQREQASGAAQAEGGHPCEPAEPRPKLRRTQRMRQRIKSGIAAIESAEHEGLKHVSLTDPDARMLHGGRSQQVKECHSFEVSVDNGLIVSSSASTESDNDRLLDLVEASKAFEPEGVISVDADSGYYRGEDIAKIEQSGIDTCIPTSATACDLHNGFEIGATRRKSTGTVEFTYDGQSDCWVCPQHNRLRFIKQMPDRAQTVRVYRSERACTGCPLARECLIHKNTKHRTKKVGLHSELLQAVQNRFGDPARQDRYRHRGSAVETVFAFLRGTLGFSRWLLRGRDRVAQEAALMHAAYQFRKIHKLQAITSTEQAA